MTITVLTTGRLVADPQRRTGSSGKPFTTAKVGTVDAEGNDTLVSLIAFGQVAEQLAALGKGDTLAVTGKAKLSTWEKDGATKVGLSVTADAILTAYHAKKRRAAMQPADDHDQRREA